MLLRIFTFLSETLNSTPGIAVAGAFLWGIAGMVLSPCHLASIPLIVGFIGGQGRMSTRRALGVSAMFSLGLLVTIAGIGLLTGLLGRMLGDIGRYGHYAVAAVFFVTGLHMLGLVPMPFSGTGGQPSVHGRGAGAAFLLGLVFGLALGPCTFAFMMPMLGVVFNVAATDLLFAASLVAAYALGHCSIILLAGTFTGTVRNLLQWNEHSSGLDRLKKVCGILVIAGGIYLVVSRY